MTDRPAVSVEAIERFAEHGEPTNVDRPKWRRALADLALSAREMEAELANVDQALKHFGIWPSYIDHSDENGPRRDSLTRAGTMLAHLNHFKDVEKVEKERDAMRESAKEMEALLAIYKAEDVESAEELAEAVEMIDAMREAIKRAVRGHFPSSFFYSNMTIWQLRQELNAIKGELATRNVMPYVADAAAPQTIGVTVDTEPSHSAHKIETERYPLAAAVSPQAGQPRDAIRRAVRGGGATDLGWALAALDLVRNALVSAGYDEDSSALHNLSIGISIVKELRADLGRVLKEQSLNPKNEEGK